MILLASVASTAMGALTKAAHDHVDTANIVLWRSLIVAAVAYGLVRRQRLPLRAGSPGLMLWRSLIGVCAMVCFFWSLSRIPLGTATTLIYTHPLFTVTLAGPLLGERPRRAAYVLAALAFGGVLLVVRPGSVPVTWGSVAALSAGLMAALAYLSVRKLRATDPPARIVFWFSLISAAVVAPFAVAAGLPTGAEAWLLLGGIGVAATGAQMGMTWAYRVERAEIVGPFSYATIVLSYLVGLVVWDEVIDLWAGAGVALVVAAGAALSRYAAASSSGD
ncbi:MAG: hypothetical protein CSA66_04845 [Proteobacteria bacterium]|nr:MAG: hypothetical protein CSA66_04845 [Pseudomonadota bacterium]